MQPYMWMEPRPVPVVIHPVVENHIYGRVIWWSNLYVLRYDGEVFSAFDNERMLLTTRDKDRVRKFIEWV